MKPTLFWLLAMSFSAAVQATSFVHSTDVLEELRLTYDRNDPAEKAAYYRGYVAGVADSTYGSAWCPPARVSAEQTHAIVSKYIQGNPAMPGNRDAVEIVRTALGESFPCRMK